MNKAPLHKHVKFVAKKSAKKMGVLQAARSISREKYTEKVSASLLYGLLSSIAVNFFFQPGHVYSSGATGLAQVLSALSVRTLGFEIPVSLTFYAINIPLLILAWYKIGHKFFYLYLHYSNDELPFYSGDATCNLDRGSFDQCYLWWFGHGNGDWFRFKITYL